MSKVILIIDDQPDALRALSLWLQLRGYTVHMAENGEAGVALASVLRPDVVLCDLGLPDIDGFTVARRLRHMQPLPVLAALTGYGSDADRARSKAAGFIRHFLKPADLNEVLALIEAA